jgi:hypothetical protein
MNGPPFHANLVRKETKEVGKETKETKEVGRKQRKWEGNKGSGKGNKGNKGSGKGNKGSGKETKEVGKKRLQVPCFLSTESLRSESRSAIAQWRQVSHQVLLLKDTF